MKNVKAFTLIELLVVIVIIGILATIGTATYRGTIEKAQRGVAKAEMAEIDNAVKRFVIETGYMVGGFPVTQCTDTAEYSLADDCGGGLVCAAGDAINNDGAFNFGGVPGWSGPYIEDGLLIDPWGTPYIFDYDIFCGNGTHNGFPELAPEDCDGHTGTVSGLMSAGPDQEWLSYDDNEIIIYCKD